MSLPVYTVVVRYEQCIAVEAADAREAEYVIDTNDELRRSDLDYEIVAVELMEEADD